MARYKAARSIRLWAKWRGGLIVHAADPACLIPPSIGMIIYGVVFSPTEAAFSWTLSFAQMPQQIIASLGLNEAGPPMCLWLSTWPSVSAACVSTASW